MRATLWIVGLGLLVLAPATGIAQLQTKEGKGGTTAPTAADGSALYHEGKVATTAPAANGMYHEAKVVTGPTAGDSSVLYHHAAGKKLMLKKVCFEGDLSRWALKMGSEDRISIDGARSSKDTVAKPDGGKVNVACFTFDPAVAVKQKDVVCANGASSAQYCSIDGEVVGD